MLFSRIACFDFGHLTIWWASCQLIMNKLQSYTLDDNTKTLQLLCLLWSFSDIVYWLSNIKCLRRMRCIMKSLLLPKKEVIIMVGTIIIIYMHNTIILWPREISCCNHVNAWLPTTVYNHIVYVSLITSVTLKDTRRNKLSLSDLQNTVS